MGHSDKDTTPGDLPLTGPLTPVPEATGNTLSALTDIAGPTLLREADGISTVMTPPQVPREIPEEITISLGLLTGKQLEEWLLTHTERNTRLGTLLTNAINTAPNWFAQVHTTVKLTPVIGHSTWVENSSIAIHFDQTMTTPTPPHLDRTHTSLSILLILNHIISTALPEIELFEIKDINFFEYHKQTKTPAQQKNHRRGTRTPPTWPSSTTTFQVRVYGAFSGVYVGCCE